MKYLALALLIATPAAAQTTLTDVRGMLYPRAGIDVEILPKDYLPADQAALLRTVGVQQPYYGAIAISPAEGIMTEATVAAANYHTTDAAATAALRDCNAKRKAERACEVVGYIRPAGWQQQPVQLSQAATAAFLNDFRGEGPKAFAISPSTGEWGLAKGAGAADAAIAECGAGCRVILQN
ncbi:5-aminolevulic acid synthase [Falsirhodobacter halotolerans]|uniref:5-aminolevulic acid synthase n=1 Tax=Falsirhodobacter halotolerans TaxID=1146892 RepID=UPI001FD069BB|nr:5-aminolevulic acid synthase [Falsirhodobacter halotolerans]MCJ8140224.1 5-aminolevulic acid synthase [Falsirhodobacter halotolerans]